LATLRLAREIHRLEPNRARPRTRPSFRKRWRRELHWWLTDRCYKPWNLNIAKDYPKRLRLIRLEGLRAEVERRWLPAMRKHIRQHRDYLLAPPAD
jgi:hypothetical protein